MKSYSNCLAVVSNIEKYVVYIVFIPIFVDLLLESFDIDVPQIALGEILEIYFHLLSSAVKHLRKHLKQVLFHFIQNSHFAW